MEKSVNIRNKRASHEYFLIQEVTAGIQLTGTEIKSIRAQVLGDSFRQVCFHSAKLDQEAAFVSRTTLGYFVRSGALLEALPVLGPDGATVKEHYNLVVPMDLKSGIYTVGVRVIQEVGGPVLAPSDDPTLANTGGFILIGKIAVTAPGR